MTARPGQEPKEDLSGSRRRTRRVLQYHLPDSRDVIGPVDSAKRGELLRDVPPAEGPAESAAKKRQCERSNRPKERDEFAVKATAAEG